MRGVASMKRNNLWAGLTYTAVGIALLLGVFFGVWESSLICGLGGGALGGGLVMVWKYFYWSTPKNAARYQEKLEQESIELHDELLSRLRDRSGRYAYLLGLGVISISILVLGVLKELGIVEDVRLLVLYLGAYLLFQWAAGVVIFLGLKKRY